MIYFHKNFILMSNIFFKKSNRTVYENHSTVQFDFMNNKHKKI